jgi:hypothetical protein
VRECEASDRTGHADGKVAVVVDLTRVFARRIKEHLRVGLERRFFAEIDGGRPTIREADHHEPAAADVAGSRVGDLERESGRDRRVDGIAAGQQHAVADFACDRGGRHDHAALPGDGLLRGRGRRAVLRADHCRRQRCDGERAQKCDKGEALDTLHRAPS